MQGFFRHGAIVQNVIHNVSFALTNCIREAKYRNGRLVLGVSFLFPCEILFYFFGDVHAHKTPPGPRSRQNALNRNPVNIIFIGELYYTYLQNIV